VAITLAQPPGECLRVRGEVDKHATAISDCERQRRRLVRRQPGSAAGPQRPVDELGDEAAIQHQVPRLSERLPVMFRQVSAIGKPSGPDDRVTVPGAEQRRERGLSGSVAAFKHDHRMPGGELLPPHAFSLPRFAESAPRFPRGSGIR